MKIQNILVSGLKIPLKRPFKTALRTVSAVDDIIVKIVTDTEHTGYGEAAPTAVITGETKPSIFAAVKKIIAPALIGMDIENFEEILYRLHGVLEKNTSAKAAVDMALYDLLAKNYGAPLYRLLGGFRKSIKTDLTISVGDASSMLRDSRAAVAAGYDILKIKVGKEPGKDIENIRAIRKAAGKNIALRIDANQGWTPKEAVRIIRRLEDMDTNIELVEQPVKAWDRAGLRFVTKNVLTPILADESVFSALDAFEIIKTHAADMINIKLMKTGGIHEALKICALAEIHGVGLMMGCMLEGYLSCGAAAHLACAKKAITKADIDGPGLCAAAPFSGGPDFSGSVIRMNKTPGIGFNVSQESRIHWV